MTLVTHPLDDGESARWTAWKWANDAVAAAVAEAIQEASGLSVPDFSVLSRVLEDGGGRMHQQELGNLLGWQRARLSRQLSRMTERDLVERSTDAGRRRLVAATAGGRRALGLARPAHAETVRRVLLAPSSGPGGSVFWDVLGELAADLSGPGARP